MRRQAMKEFNLSVFSHININRGAGPIKEL